jgi:hypothetical protein
MSIKRIDDGSKITIATHTTVSFLENNCQIGVYIFYINGTSASMELYIDISSLTLLEKLRRDAKSQNVDAC